jgi:hypothetical protein
MKSVARAALAPTAIASALQPTVNEKRRELEALMGKGPLRF